MPHNTDVIDIREAIRIVIIGTVQSAVFCTAIIAVIHFTIGLGTWKPL